MTTDKVTKRKNYSATHSRNVEMLFISISSLLEYGKIVSKYFMVRREKLYFHFSQWQHMQLMRHMSDTFRFNIKKKLRLKNKMRWLNASGKGRHELKKEINLIWRQKIGFSLAFLCSLKWYQKALECGKCVRYTCNGTARMKKEFSNDLQTIRSTTGETASR